MAYLHVEIIEIIILSLKKGTEIVLVIIEKRRLIVGTHQSEPVLMAPIAVVANTNIFYQIARRPLYRHRKRLQAVGCCYHTTVAIGLLLEGLLTLH